MGALGLITVTILVGNAAFQTGNLVGASIDLNLGRILEASSMIP